MFEAKTVQRMELLVLSGLKWKMSLVTPFSFLDHLFRRFALRKVRWPFLKICGSLVLSVTSGKKLSSNGYFTVAALTVCI